jgi:WhiB family redox-sensing transcriptional regulator
VAAVETDDVVWLVALAALFGADDFANQTWRTEAACRGQDPNFWHPARGAPLAPRRRICQACPVRLECLSYGLTQGNGVHETGVWGGSSGKQRRLAKKRGWDAATLLAHLD